MAPNNKYTKGEKEKKHAFVARIVISEDRPMTANDVVSCIHKKTMEKMNPLNVHSNLSDSSGRYELIAKTRMKNAQGQKRVHYHPIGMVVEGEDIQVPAFTKTTGYKHGASEQVVADLGASSLVLPSAKPAPRNHLIKVDKGWVKMVDSKPSTFILNSLATVAETMNWSMRRTERVILQHLRDSHAGNVNRLLMHHLIESLLDTYGRSPLITFQTPVGE